MICIKSFDFLITHFDQLWFLGWKGIFVAWKNPSICYFQSFANVFLLVTLYRIFHNFWRFNLKELLILMLIWLATNYRNRSASDLDWAHIITWSPISTMWAAICIDMNVWFLSKCSLCQSCMAWWSFLWLLFNTHWWNLLIFASIWCMPTLTATMLALFTFFRRL